MPIPHVAFQSRLDSWPAQQLETKEIEREIYPGPHLFGVGFARNVAGQSKESARSGFDAVSAEGMVKVFAASKRGVEPNRKKTSARLFIFSCLRDRRKSTRRMARKRTELPSAARKKSVAPSGGRAQAHSVRVVAGRLARFAKG